MQCLRGRVSDCRLRRPGFESCAAVLKPGATLHCSSSLSCINEYLAIDSGGYVYEQPSCINCSIWYSFIQLSELEQCRVKKLAQGFNTAAQDSNLGPFSRQSEALPLSHLQSGTEVPLLLRDTFLAMHSHVLVTPK